MEQKVNTYTKEIVTSYSYIDAGLRLGVVGAMRLSQDMVTEYYGAIGTDNITIKTHSGALWVMLRCAFHFKRMPVWNEKIVARSYMTEISTMHAVTETLFCTEKGEELFVSRHDMCPIDVQTRKLRTIESIVFPVNLPVEKSFLPDAYCKFERMNAKADSMEKILTHTATSHEIDFSNHINNICYAEYMLDGFGADCLRKQKPLYFEVHYISEGKEGEALSVFRGQKSEREYDFAIRLGEKDLTRAVYRYEEA